MMRNLAVWYDVDDFGGGDEVPHAVMEVGQASKCHETAID